MSRVRKETKSTRSTFTFTRRRVTPLGRHSRALAQATGRTSRQPALTVRRPLLRSEAGVSLSRFRRLREHARAVLRRHLVHRIDHLEAARSAAGHDDDARPLTSSDEDVVCPRRAVDEVPRRQAALLTFDHEHALSGNDKEVFLARLAVVRAALAAPENLDAEAELGPLLLPFEVGVLP